MEIVLAILTGIAIGAILGYVGAGGSMLAVPAFIYIFEFNPVQATTAALIVVFIGAASGALPKLRKNEILIKEALVIWAIGLSTNFTGAYFLPQIPEKTILSRPKDQISAVTAAQAMPSAGPPPRIGTCKAIRAAIWITQTTLRPNLSGKGAVIHGRTHDAATKT